MKLLIVEDEEILLNNMMHSVQWSSHGIELLPCARDGEEALYIINTQTPDIIVTDIRMPHMDGIQLMKAVRLMGLDVDFIILSAYSDFEYAREVIRYGGHDYITKPVSTNELLHAVLSVANARQRRYAFCNATDAKTMEQNLMAQLLFCNTISNSLKAFAANLGLDIADACFSVSILSSIFIEAYVNKLPEEIDELLSKAKSAFQGYAFLAGYYNNTILMIGKGQIQRVIFKERLEEFERNTGLKDTILSFSTESDSLADIHKLYQQAMSAKEYHWYGPCGTQIIGFSDLIIAQNPDVSARISVLIDSMISQLDFSSETQLKKCIHNFFSAMSSERNLLKETLCVKCVELYTNIDRKLKENYGTKACLGNAEEIFRRVKNTTHWFDARNEMLVVLENLLAEYKRESAASGFDLTRTIKKYIADHISERISLEDIAAFVYRNPAYLSTTFKKENQISIHEYITQVKIKKAQTYLTGSAMTVQHISDILGFSDYHYFCTVFKKETGLTPLEYRSRTILKE